MSIQARLTLFICGLIFATLIGTLAILGLSELIHLRHAQTNEQWATLEKMARVCEESVMSHNDVVLLNYVQSLQASPSVAYAAFIAPDDTVQVHTDVSQIGAKRSDPVAVNAQQSQRSLRQDFTDDHGRDIIDIAMPVTRQQRRLGTAHIGYDAAALQESINKLLRDSLRRFVWVVVMALGIGLAGAVLLARSFNRPIAQLVEGARSIGQGRLDTQLQVARQDELGVLAEEFNSMANQLKQLDELKESFVAKITHDLRNPLAGILGYIDMLLMGAIGPLQDPQTKALKVAQRSCVYLAELIDNILDITKLEAGKMELAPVPVGLAEAARQAIEVLQAKSSEFGVTITAEVPPEAVVLADQEALKRVLINLLSNALKFTPSGGRVTVLASRHGQWWRVGIWDTGIGIPASKVGLLFKKFSQIGDETGAARPRMSGTGLGLVICKEIVAAHKGEIWVESKPGVGSLFQFTLPAEG